MLETSKDVLYLVIAFCVLWVTVFICWMFYYMTKILRNASEITEEFRVRLEALSEAINHVRDKVEQMTSLMTLATGGVSGLMKRMATKKVKSVINKGTKAFDKAAKEAVGNAVKATKKKIKKVGKKK